METPSQRRIGVLLPVINFTRTCCFTTHFFRATFSFFFLLIFAHCIREPTYPNSYPGVPCARFKKFTRRSCLRNRAGLLETKRETLRLPLFRTILILTHKESIEQLAEQIHLVKTAGCQDVSGLARRVSSIRELEGILSSILRTGTFRGRQSPTDRHRYLAVSTRQGCRLRPLETHSRGSLYLFHRL